MGIDSNFGNLRLRPQTIFSAVLEGRKTFQELAKKYGFTLENFEKELLSKVGPKEFERLKKANERNGAKNHKTKTPKNKPKINSENENENCPAKEEKELTEVENKPLTEREKMLQQKANAEQKIASLEKEIEEAEARYNEEKLKVTEILRALRAARTKRSAAQKERDIKKSTLSQWQMCLSSIEARIKEIDSETIYLIAPGYQGNLPTAGKLISSEPFEGAIVEEGEALYKDPSMEDLFNSGFDRICDASNAYRFARLVIKYDFEGINAKVLVDDERIKRILKDQGLEI